MTRHRGGARRDTGAATVVVVAMAGVLMFVVVGLAAVGGLALSYAATARSVRAAADAVAVSGAQAHAKGADACDEARRIAERNDVQVGTCQVTGDLLDYVVEVEVRRAVGWRLPGLPERVTAVAYAGSVAGIP